MRIRSQLIFFFLIISIIPLSADVYISYENSKEAIIDSLMTSLFVATENTGLAIDNWMNARKDDIRIISQSRAVENREFEQMGENLRTVQGEYQGVYNEFFMLDMNGDIIFSTLNTTGNAGKENYFTEAAGGKIYISDVSISRISGSPEIIIANPVKKNGLITGIIAARVSLENLYGIIEKIDIGKSGEVFIVNKDGHIIFHEDRSRILTDNVTNNFAVKEVIYEKSGISEYVNYRGEEVLGSYYWLPVYRWGLIAEKNRDEAYSQISALGQRTVVISVFVILFVVLLAVVISKRLTEPIRSLKDGALGLVKGQFKPISVSSRDEIGELTEIFNQTGKELLDARKRLEKKIEIANKDLEEKNRELIHANEELRKLDSLKSDFISLVSHELKTPLSAIRTSAEYLEMEKEASPDIKKEMIENIIWNIDRQTRMINDILDLSKIEAGKMEYRFEDVDFNEVAKMTIENIRLLASKKNIGLSVEIPSNLSQVFADRDKLIIVMNNLIGNAVKFTPNGGSIHLAATEEQDSVKVMVSDTGAGIEKEQQEKIFDKFYQVDGTSRRKAGGSGLGLSISSGIIRAHGSDIYVESEPGKGSTFFFRLRQGGRI